MAQILAENIRNLRLATGLNQTLFAEKLGVTQASVARWERGAEPKSEPLKALSDLAGVSVHEFTSTLIKPTAAGPARPLAPAQAGAAIYLPVILPSEASLTKMFEVLLEIVGRDPDRGAAAQRLAQLLPDALARTLSLQSAPPRDPATGSAPDTDDPARPGATPPRPQ
jgi:transcriptional regulator with XRE-family HTH domain